MSWELFKLDDVCDVINGGSWTQDEYVSQGVKVIKVSNLVNDAIDESNMSHLPYESLSVYEKNILKSYDLVVTTVGSHPQLKASAAGRGFVISPVYEGSLLNQNTVCIRTKDENVLFNRYLGYVGRSEDFRHSIQQTGRGAANQMRIPISNIKLYALSVPPLETQKRIASILSNYDDLIENNNKRVKLLEETAQNIYKEWFVNFRFPNYENTEFDAESGLPVGWEDDNIGNQLLTIKRNGKLKTDDYKLEGKFPIIDQGSGFIAGYTNNEEVVQNTHLPVVIFGDHTRRVKFVNFPFVSGADGTQIMFPKNEKLLPAYFYLSIKNIDLSNYAYARHYKFMKEQPIIIPDEKTLDKFNKKVYPILEQTIHLYNYNQKLKEARDILLPRLMNRIIEV